MVDVFRIRNFAAQMTRMAGAAREQIGRRRRHPPIRHVNHLDPGGLCKQISPDDWWFRRRRSRSAVRRASIWPDR